MHSTTGQMYITTDLESNFLLVVLYEQSPKVVKNAAIFFYTGTIVNNE